MSNITNISRRDLLRGAGGALGTTLLAGGGTAMAQTLVGAANFGAPSVAAPVSVGFWNGASFVAATSLAAGDETLERVLLTITSFGVGDDIKAFDAVAYVTGQAGVQAMPFQCLIAAPQGGRTTKFPFPVDPVNGITFNAHLKAIPHEISSLVRLTTGKIGNKLREGLYVVKAGPLHWPGMSYDATQPLPLMQAGGAPLTSQYLLLTVSRA